MRDAVTNKIKKGYLYIFSNSGIYNVESFIVLKYT